MRFFFCTLLFFAACGDDKPAEQQCFEGARSVDGTPCCFPLMGEPCNGNPLGCIQDRTAMCTCESGVVFCTDIPIAKLDMAVPDLSPRDN